jgi:hypothetical protein
LSLIGRAADGPVDVLGRWRDWGGLLNAVALHCLVSTRAGRWCVTLDIVRQHQERALAAVPNMEGDDDETRLRAWLGM